MSVFTGSMGPRRAAVGLRAETAGVCAISERLLETSDYSVDEVAGRCGFRSPVALRGHFRR
ncbi:hypothetical protein, partial [Streptomyces sp. NPDC002922]|uniref:hypothetical protein n=1 Tax=Streptomyces sp. NPDC002922 TaxID=3154439 RepID=UPI00339FCC76